MELVPMALPFWSLFRRHRHTIAAILLRNGVEPAPERSRKTSWKEFLTQTLRSHRGGGFLYH
jgi:hypothetical protein